MKQKVDHLYFIDNLKIGLIMLVVVHHAGQAYGPGDGGIFKKEKF
ncbi:hypothetical protein ACWE42_13695 [Sutcliffiella cohnii]|nr:hypothetical protein [Sutcliffiella cohnii]